MRVALLLNTNVGGRWSVDGMRVLRERGHEVRAYLADEPGDLADRYRDAGIEVVQLAYDKRGGRAAVASWRELRRDLREFQPDVVAYYLYKASLFGRTVAATLKIPTVHLIVGPIFLEITPTRMVERIAHRFDSHVIAGSEAIRRSLESLGRKHDVSVIYPPCDLERFQLATPQERTDARAELGVASGAFVATMVAFFYADKGLFGVGAHAKGHDVALRAWHASERAPEDRLFIVGGGFREVGREYRNDFIAEHAELIDETVVFVDTVTDVRPYYRVADVSIAPSLTENLGSAQEAAAIGVPTIGSRTGGIPEIVVDGYSGWLVTPRNVTELTSALEDARAAKHAGQLSERGVRSHGMITAMCERSMVAEALADQIEATAARGR